MSYMSDEAFEPLLNREEARITVEEFAKRVSKLLRGRINFATQVFQECQLSATGAIDEDLALLLLYLHIIEMADGIEILLVDSAVPPAKPLLRSSFEALLGILYILENDYQRRALSYAVSYIHTRIDLNEKFDATTKAGQDFRRDIANDLYMNSLDLDPEQQVQLQNEISTLKGILSKSHLIPIEAEYQRLKDANKKRPYWSPNWYSLFNGPASVAALAKKVRRFSEYTLHYGSSSEIVHAVDVKRFLSRDEAGNPAFKALRNPEDIREVTLRASKYLHEATELMLNKFGLSEEQVVAKYKAS